jgi:hypothetical protein
LAQAVSRRLPTAAARVRAQVRSCGICGGQSGTGADFLRVLRIPLPILIPPLFHIHHLSSGASKIGQLVADVPSGLSLTPPQEPQCTCNSFTTQPCTERLPCEKSFLQNPKFHERVHTRAWHLTQSCARSIQSAPASAISLRSICSVPPALTEKK